MTPQDFIRKWRANTRAERAAAQEHFIDLCRLLGEPTPNEDPDGATYAFEKGATKATGGEGWADVWRRGRFAWEYKGKHKDLEAAHRQLLLYAGALENPPLLITSDIERIVIRTNWTGYASERHDILLDELADPARLKLLKWAFAEPERLRPATTRQALTEKAAAEFAEIAKRLRARARAARRRPLPRPPRLLRLRRRHRASPGGPVRADARRRAEDARPVRRAGGRALRRDGEQGRAGRL